MRPLLILENIRSAYNVGTMMRTADALGWQVICSGFTPTPDREDKIKKTALGAEETVFVGSYRSTHEALILAKQQGYYLIAAEKTSSSQSLLDYMHTPSLTPVAVVMGNETEGVLQETLSFVDQVVHIPMQGMKESLNVAEAASIMMWELGR